MSIPFLNHLKNEVKKEIKINISRHKFRDGDLVQFSEKDLDKAQWIDSEEFVLNENLYDVVKIKVINGKKFHFCFPDKKESKIVRLTSKIQKVLVQLKFNESSEKRTGHTIQYNLHCCKTNVTIEIFSNFEQSAVKIPNLESILNPSEFIDKIKIPPQV